MSFSKDDQLPKPTKPARIATIEASRELKRQNWWKAQEVCEICRVATWPLQPMHRHKRLWYKNQPELLSNSSQVIKACQSCHQFLESKPHITEAVFIYLRGSDA